MPIPLSQLVASIDPTKTVLLFGSGSSVPSGAPSVSDLIAHLKSKFSITSDYTLAELAGIIENKTKNRKALIGRLREKFEKLKPTGGLLNLPLYDWKSIFTTNYDHLIEAAYDRVGKPIKVYAGNVDFDGDDRPGSTKLFKLHGTIGKDVSDGYQTRLILTEADYDLTQDYRQYLYDRLKTDLAGGQLVVIGHSLADDHIREIINRAAALNHQASIGGRISLLLYTADPDRASLFEARHLQVCFGGIDEFFVEMAKNAASHRIVYSSTGDPFDEAPGLRPLTIDVDHAQTASSDVSGMFNGWPASYANISAGLTFKRTIGNAIESDYLSGRNRIGVLLGASGVGKTTAARQILKSLRNNGYLAWEHKSDLSLQPAWWHKVATSLRSSSQKGILFIDDAHHHLTALNELVDSLNSSDCSSLQILCVSSRAHWGPRIKSPLFFKNGTEYLLQKLDARELDELLNLVDLNKELKPLVEQTFSGFSRTERRRRLEVRCESETFVCLKNIFASEKFDDIILREYASLDESLQEVYRLVAAMENAGIRVHRQLVIRMTGIAADKVGVVLSRLEDIVEEYEIDAREGIYGWTGRHPVIVGIIAKYKFSDTGKIIDLFTRVIENISPTFEVEIRSIRELCNLETGLSRVPDKRVQNTLLRQMMSVAPGERVPRHRLVRNLIEMGEYEKADTEIRIFEKDFGGDGPIARYKLNLMVARAVKSPGILPEDRIAILEQARGFAASARERYKYNKNLLASCCEMGIEYYKLTQNLEVFNEALSDLKSAEVRIGDPDISRLIQNFERRVMLVD